MVTVKEKVTVNCTKNYSVMHGECDLEFTVRSNGDFYISSGDVTMEMLLEVIKLMKANKSTKKK